MPFLIIYMEYRDPPSRGSQFRYLHDLTSPISVCSVTDAFTPGSGFLVSPGLIQAFMDGDFLPDDLRQTGDEINLNDNFWDVADSTDPYDLELSRDIPIEYSDTDIATEGHYSKAEQFLSLLGAKNWYSEESQSPAIPSYRQLSQLDRLKHELVSGYIKGKRFNFLTPDGAPITPVVLSTGCQWRIKPDTPVTLHVYHLNFGDIEECTNNKLKVSLKEISLYKHLGVHNKNPIMKFKRPE